MVETFRNGIPLRRHRRHIKVYENCFTGQEAVNWFHTVLQNNLHLGSNITKEQTIQLLHKFLRAGVFQNVNGSSDALHQYIKEADLYQLTTISSPRLPLAIRSQNIQPKLKPQQWNEKSGSQISHNTVGLPKILQEIKSASPHDYNLGMRELALNQNAINSKEASSKNTNYGNQLKKHDVVGTYQKKNMSPYNKEQRNLCDIGPSSEHLNLGFIDSPNEPKICSLKKETVPHRDPCIWLDPLILDSADTFEVQRTSIPYEGAFSTMKSNSGHLEGYRHLPKSQTIHYSTSNLQPRTMFEVAAGGMEINPPVGLNRFGKVIHNGQTHHMQPFHYRAASTSQLRSSGNVKSEVITQTMGDTLRRSCSVGIPRRVVSPPVPRDDQHFQLGEAWKLVIVTRLEKLMPGLDVPLKSVLENLPGEWICSNAATKVYNDHDSHFPQSLVAAMNCLVHWPQAVPTEILTAFKEHYFKLKEPLTTFKMYLLLSKAYVYFTSSAMIPHSNAILSMKLPPNSCFETAFTSDSPVTRIVPQRSVDTLHFSRHGRFTRSSVPKRIASAPNLSEQLMTGIENQKPNSHPGTKNKKCGKFAVKISRRMSQRVCSGSEEDKMHHMRNKSGGYVNPALSKSIDDQVMESLVAPEPELDYIAALESLNTLMKCSRRDSSLNAVGHPESDGPSSESSSYYTAASSSSSAASSRRSSLDIGDSLHRSMEEGKEKALVSAMQLILLCIPAYCRTQLRYLLHFMNQWNTANSLCVQADVIQIFTSTILRSNIESDLDFRLAYDVVHFLVTHHELILNVPMDLEAEVNRHFSLLHSQNIKPENRVSYCEQVSSQQFEQQKLTSSQLALSELLEQILQDCKMTPKEKRKRLKMFKESYPHIYHRRFPDSAALEKALKKLPGGLLNLAALSRLKSLRV